MRVPTSTYRFQLSEALDLEAARALLPYLRALGVGDVYLSPVMQARAGSAHGYDCLDPTRVSEELGGEPALAALAEDAHGREMGVLLDIVPNHLAADERGPWWRDVLEHGRSSPFAAVFDIDWEPESGLVRDRVVLPILADHYAAVLERGELRLALRSGALVLRYFDHELPVEPASYGIVLLGPLGGDGVGLDIEPDALRDMTRDLAAGFLALPPHASSDPAAAAARRDMTGVLHSRFAAMLVDVPGFRIHVEEAVAGFNGRPGEPGSFESLDALLQLQPYLLAFWRLAAEEINYRRFFNIAELVGTRVEQDRVFEMLHEPILRWVRDGTVDGLRVDHVDGLLDPGGYVDRLRYETGDAPYRVVEKILVGEERLPDGWPVAGTTGYDFLNLVSGVLTPAAGLAGMQAAYERFTGSHRPFVAIEWQKQRQVIRTQFAGEIASLQRRLAAAARGIRQGRDIPARAIGAALLEVTACLPVYRTYVRGPEPAERDRRVIEQAVEIARRRNPAVGDDVYDVVRRVLLLDLPRQMSDEQRDEWLDVVMRWQQLTGPVMAKGVEDTSLYVFNPLLSLNDVGGDPGSGALEPADFHRRMAERAQAWPHTMNASSTHDTKRSEDVRARLHALAEMGGEWHETLSRWHDWNDELRGPTGAPDPNEEVLLYQTLLGAWPLTDEHVPEFRQRLSAYVLKAAREAKVNTSWVDPDEAYETDLLAFVERLLHPGREGPFLADLRRMLSPIEAAGAIVSLAQLALKLLAPGVPDFYQGTELWCLTLVDPDNRRPVDYDLRRALLRVLTEGDSADPVQRAAKLMRDWRSGAIKNAPHARRVAAATSPRRALRRRRVPAPAPRWWRSGSRATGARVRAPAPRGVGDRRRASRRRRSARPRPPARRAMARRQLGRPHAPPPSRSPRPLARRRDRPRALCPEHPHRPEPSRRRPPRRPPLRTTGALPSP